MSPAAKTLAAAGRIGLLVGFDVTASVEFDGTLGNDVVGDGADEAHGEENHVGWDLEFRAGYSP